MRTYLYRAAAALLALSFTFSLTALAAVPEDPSRHTEELKPGCVWDCEQTLTCESEEHTHTEECYRHLFPTCYLGNLDTADHSSLPTVEYQGRDAKQHKDGRVCIQHISGWYYTVDSDNGPALSCNYTHTPDLGGDTGAGGAFWLNAGDKPMCNQEEHGHSEECYEHICHQVPAGTYTVTYTATDGYTLAYKGGAAYTVEMPTDQPLAAFGVWLEKDGVQDKGVVMTLDSSVIGFKRDNSAVTAEFPTGEVISSLNGNGDATPYRVTSNGEAFGYFLFEAGTEIFISVSPIETEVIPSETPSEVPSEIPSEVPSEIPSEAPSEPSTGGGGSGGNSGGDDRPSRPSPVPSQTPPSPVVTEAPAVTESPVEIGDGENAIVDLPDTDVPLGSMPETGGVDSSPVASPAPSDTLIELLPAEAAPVILPDELVILDDSTPLGNLPQTGTTPAGGKMGYALLALFSGSGLAALSIFLFRKKES